MKGHIRNIYPGGNTPEGFYSYYNYILPQRKAEKIFCLKGGPGVGKSTFMKEIGKYFSEKGEDVDLLWCSSDADSLDGVVLKSRRAFERLEFTGYEIASVQEWYKRKASRDHMARRQYFDLERNRRQRGDLYITTILDEEMKPDDPRLR